MDEETLYCILAKHETWLKTQGKKGKKAHFDSTNLSRADLFRVNLSKGNLYRVKLSGATLVEADLSGASLFGVDLSKANLQGADLTGADLSEAKGVLGFYLGKDFGYCWVNSRKQKIVKIGCEEKPLKYWLKKYKALGEKHKYSKEEVKLYGQMLKLLQKARL